MSKPSTFERKKLPNGKVNPKYVDLCDEDQPIAGQKFACLSFVSPEKYYKSENYIYLINLCNNGILLNHFPSSLIFYISWHTNII